MGLAEGLLTGLTRRSLGQLAYELWSHCAGRKRPKNYIRPFIFTFFGGVSFATERNGESYCRCDTGLAVRQPTAQQIHLTIKGCRQQKHTSTIQPRSKHHAQPAQPLPAAGECGESPLVGEREKTGPRWVPSGGRGCERCPYQRVDVLGFVDEHADFLWVSVEYGLDERRLRGPQRMVSRRQPRASQTFLHSNILFPPETAREAPVLFSVNRRHVTKSSEFTCTAGRQIKYLDSLLYSGFLCPTS